MALGHLGRTEECERYLSELLKLEPAFNIHSFIKDYPFVRDEDRQSYIDGLTKAGAPASGPPRLAVVDNGKGRG